MSEYAFPGPFKCAAQGKGAVLARESAAFPAAGLGLMLTPSAGRLHTPGHSWSSSAYATRSRALKHQKSEYGRWMHQKGAGARWNQVPLRRGTVTGSAVFSAGRSSPPRYAEPTERKCHMARD